MSDLLKRTLVIIFFAPVVFFSVFKWSFLFFLIVLSSSFLVMFEIFQMARMKNIPVYPLFSYFSVFFVLFYFYFVYPDDLNAFYSFLWIFDVFRLEYHFVIFVLFLSMFLIIAFRTFSSSFNLTVESVGVYVFSFVYAGLSLSYLFWIREISSFFLLYLLLITWTSDSFAYIVGKYFARRRVNLMVSPNKTLEGFIAAFFFPILFAFILREIAFYFDVLDFLKFSYLSYFFLTLFLSAAAVLGDLAGSVIKRSFGVKDSQSYIPGHGGMIDVLDSLIYTGPLFFFILEFFFI